MIQTQQCVEAVPITESVIPPEAGGDCAQADLAILVVDDDLDCREVVCRLLRGAGCQARAVASGRKALAEIAKPEIGLVVTDMHMPDGNGIQLIEQIVKTRPELEIIVFSGQATDSTRQRAHELGCRAVIDKPDSDELLRLARAALGSDRTERLAAEGRPVRKPELGRVLLVDDHPEFARVVNKLLEKRGYRTTIAHDGVEALERFTAGEFELVLMDINMPRMDGVEATRRIRQVDRNVSILLISGESSSQQVFAALSAGAESMLPKPVNLALLERTVGEYVATARRRRRLARREKRRQERRAQRSAPKKVLRWLQSPRTAGRRRSLFSVLAAAVLALMVGAGAAHVADLTFNAGRFASSIVERFEGRLDRLEGYLNRDEQRELDQQGRGRRAAPPARP